MITALKIISSTREQDAIENVGFIKVDFHLLDATSALIAERSLRFPLEATEEEINTELTKYLSTQILEEESALANKEIDEINNVADEVVQSLQGKTIVAEGAELAETETVDEGENL